MSELKKYLQTLEKKVGFMHSPGIIVGIGCEGKGTEVTGYTAKNILVNLEICKNGFFYCLLYNSHFTAAAH